MFFKKKCFGLQNFLPPTQCPVVLQPEVWGTYVPGTGNLGWGPAVGLGLLTPAISLPKFYPSYMGVGPAHSMSPTPPTSLDGCDSFNSIVVRIPFNLIV